MLVVKLADYDEFVYQLKQLKMSHKLSIPCVLDQVFLQILKELLIV